MSAPALPQTVARGVEDFVAAAEAAFDSDLRSVVLYGSAAEGRLRATSDVNVVLVLASFNPAKAEQLRPAQRIAEAAIRLRAMFLLESEIPEAARTFAQKFADIARRRHVLKGADPFAGLQVPRDAEIAQLRQQLLNLVLRLRAAYVSRGTRGEQLALLIADAAGPLRSCAATLLELEGQPFDSPKHALEQFADSVAEPSETLAQISMARESGKFTPESAAKVLLRLMELARRMHERATTLQ